MHNLALTYERQGKIDRGSKDARGSVGEDKGDLGRRSSVHADEHAQPRKDVPTARKNDRGGKDARGSVGEEKG